MTGTLCIRCDFEIKEANLSSSQKQEVMRLHAAGDVVKTVQYLKDSSGLDLANCKAILDHLSPVTGKCTRCANDSLAGEYVICPKCKSVNVNW